MFDWLKKTKLGVKRSKGLIREKLRLQRAGQILKVVAVSCFLIIILPLLFATIFGVSPSRTMELVGSTFVLEYLAILLGVALKLPPAFVFLTVVSVGIGEFILMLGVFRLIGEKSKKVVNFLLKLKGSARRLEKYGIYGLIPGAILLGMDGCAATAWVFGWDIRRSALLSGAGFVIIAIILQFSIIGILKVI